MSTWVCEDPDVVELVNAVRVYRDAMHDGQFDLIEPAWDRVLTAMEAIPIPEDER